MRFAHLLLFNLLLFTLLNSYGQKPVINYVTVLENGNVEINWVPINGVQGYDIYRSKTNDNQSGFNPITTVSGDNSFQYIDTEIDAREMSIGYKIQYTDSTLLSEPHYSVFLETVEYDSCAMTNTLKWHPYKGTNINYYNVLDGAGNELGVNINDTVFIHNITGGAGYNYEVVAVGSGVLSKSNQVSVYTTELVQPSVLSINKIDYSSPPNVNLNVLVDNSADLLGHILMASNDNNTFSEAAFTAFSPDSSSISFSHTAGNLPMYYKIYPVMVCNDTLTDIGETVRSILLVPESSDETQVTLNWNSSYIESSENYNIAITVDGQPKSPQQTESNKATFQFNDLDSKSTSENFCFTITANELNGGKSISNEVCVTRQAKIEAPTAFTPNGDGINDYFGPFYEPGNEDSYIKNAVVDQFELIIYDKFGGAVFVSDKGFKRWDGTVNYRPVTEGGYIYFLEFTTAQGKTYQKSGTINVVFP